MTDTSILEQLSTSHPAFAGGTTTNGLSSASLSGGAAVAAIYSAYLDSLKPVPKATPAVAAYAPVQGFSHETMKQFFVQGWKG